jgi:hypothetical protein
MAPIVAFIFIFIMFLCLRSVFKTNLLEIYYIFTMNSRFLSLSTDSFLQHTRSVFMVFTNGVVCVACITELARAQTLVWTVYYVLLCQEKIDRATSAVSISICSQTCDRFHFREWKFVGMRMRPLDHAHLSANPRLLSDLVSVLIQNRARVPYSNSVINYLMFMMMCMKAMPFDVTRTFCFLNPYVLNY